MSDQAVMKSYAQNSMANMAGIALNQTQMIPDRPPCLVDKIVTLENELREQRIRMDNGMGEIYSRLTDLERLVRG